ncbi:MAG: Gfo/Idh/MocA family oxidoreductase [Marinicaulis sp.]|nr:Gfo/Idh/MocA family oxidoreductase [Marinicaulis sp.]
MSGKVRVGVVGAGVFGGYHAAKIADLNSAELTAIYDIDKSRASKLATHHNTNAANSFDEIIAETDALIIAAPASEHFDLAKRAMLRSRHVLVEKPIALSTDEAEELVQISKAKNVVLQVGHQERFVCQSAGLLPLQGEPFRIDCVREVAATGRCEDVSVIFDLMIHDIDIVRQMTGADIVRSKVSGDYNDVAAELLLENGAVVTLKASRRSMSPKREIKITQNSGVISFNFVDHELSVSGAEEMQQRYAEFDKNSILRDPLAHEDNLFISAVANGERPAVTGKEALASVAWAQHIEFKSGIATMPEQAFAKELQA